MQVTYITTHQDITAEQMETLLLGCHGNEIPEGFVAPTIDTTKRVSHYSIDLGDRSQPSYFYLDLTAISHTPQGRGHERFADAVLDAYIELAPRSGEFEYAGDLSRFILTQARAVARGSRFYRDHGIAIYQVVSELVTQMERDNLILSELTPELLCTQQAVPESNGPSYSPIVRVVADPK